MKTRKFARTVSLALACLLALAGTAMAAKGGTQGPPEGGEGAAPNRMSFPAIYNTDILANWQVPQEPVLGVDYSYGCDQEEFYDVYSYPNTSCVDNLMGPLEEITFYTAEQCVQAGYPCEGYEVYRIYWQKNADNIWSADQDTNPGEAVAAYLDWGDALEAVSWNERSKVRVETQPYSSTILEFDPSVETCATAAGTYASDLCKIGFHMWHVSGQGITEHWGVKADEAGTSYNYDSPFQIIRSDSAKLNLAKMAMGDADCPSPGGGDEEEVAVQALSSVPVNSAPGTFIWDAANHVWKGDAGTVDPCTWRDAVYSVETSVGGKYVYGYNWDMKSVDMLPHCGTGWLKTGWWRLTFYTPDNAVRFDDPLVSEDSDPLPYYRLTAPPAVPSAARDLSTRGEEGFYIDQLTEPFIGAAELYQPVVDVTDNLTYLDICIVAKEQGSGGGGGGGGGGPPAGSTSIGGGVGGGKPEGTPGLGGGRGQGGEKGKKVGHYK